MNAGANGKEIKDIVKSVKCIDYNGNEKKFTKEELEFGYRTSIFKKEKYYRRSKLRIKQRKPRRNKKQNGTIQKL